MRKIASISAALALASTVGIANAQVSNDDFSVLTGPNAKPAVSSTQAAPERRLVSNVELQQGIVGPQAPRAASTITREQVKRERDIARAQGVFEPGAAYLNIAGAPTTRGTVAGVPAGQ